MTDMASLRDHDLLVGLNGKVDRMGDDIREIKSNTAVTFDNQEKRIRNLEDTTKIYDLVSINKTVKDHEKWIDDFKASWKMALFLVGLFSGVIGFIFSTINYIWPFIKR